MPLSTWEYFEPLSLVFLDLLGGTKAVFSLWLIIFHY